VKKDGGDHYAEPDDGEFINEVDCIDITSPTMPEHDDSQADGCSCGRDIVRQRGTGVGPLHAVEALAGAAPDGSGYQPAVAGWL
jgi:hypothetical protein